MNHVGSMCFHWGKCLTSSLKRLSHGWWIAIFGLKPRPEKSPAIGTTCGMWSLNYRMFLMVPITLSGFGRMLQTTSKIKTSLWYASEVFWMTKPTPSISAFLWCCAERILDPSFSFFLIPWEKKWMGTILYMYYCGSCKSDSGNELWLWNHVCLLGARHSAAPSILRGWSGVLCGGCASSLVGTPIQTLGHVWIQILQLSIYHVEL